MECRPVLVIICVCSQGLIVNMEAWLQHFKQTAEWSRRRLCLDGTKLSEWLWFHCLGTEEHIFNSSDLETRRRCPEECHSDNCALRQDSSFQGSFCTVFGALSWTVPKFSAQCGTLHCAIHFSVKCRALDTLHRPIHFHEYVPIFTFGKIIYAEVASLSHSLL